MVCKDYITRDSGVKCITSISNMVGELYDRIGDIGRLLQELEPSDVVARDCYNRLLAENDDLRKERNALVHKCASLEEKAREIVRCRECKYRAEDDFCTGRGWPDQLVEDNGFCDKGKRKDGGQDDGH